jgi:hypothetical protein
MGKYVRRVFATEQERQAAIDEVLKLWADDIPQRLIATQVGVSQPTVNMWLRRFGAPTRAQQQIAEKIRRELVCCDIFQRMEAVRADLMAQQRLRESADWHHICYYGEWAAQIALQVGR